MRNTAFEETYFFGEEPPTQRQLALWVVGPLRALFPRSWKVEHLIIGPVTPEAGLTATRRKADLSFVLIDPTGRNTRFVVEVKTKLEPRDVENLSRYLEAYRAGNTNVMVVAPFISVRTQELLTKSGINYLDMTGNARVQIERPAVYIERQGETKNPWRYALGLQSLAGPAAGRVVRALCDCRPPYGVRKLAAYAQTSPGTVSKILTLLDREALIQRAARGKYAGEVVEVKWRDLIRRWTQDYGFETSNTTVAYLEPRGLDALFRKLKAPIGLAVQYSITGSFAGAEFAPIVQPRLLTLYVETIDSAASSLGLRRAERGANVVLAQPFDPVVFTRTVVRDGLSYVAPSQAAADLLTGPGRGPQEGAALLQWMEEHEDAWRT